MNDFNPAEVYQAQLQKHGVLLQRLQKRRSFFGWLRLILVVATIGFGYLAFDANQMWGWIIIGLGVIVFLIVLHKDTDNNAEIANTTALININSEELKILEHQFHNRFNGSDIAPSLHAYSDDLDVFGRASLYQYINRCSTDQGKSLIAHNLLNPLPVENVKARHEAVKEMSTLFQWQQQFQAYAQQTPVTIDTQQRIQNWLFHEAGLFTNASWSWFVPLYSLVTIGSAVAAALDYIPTSIFSFLFFLFFLFASSQSKKVISLYADLSGIVAETDALSKLISSLEGQIFTSPLLKEVQHKIKPPSGTAWHQIKALKSILGRFDLRLNMLLFIFLNSFLLWDVRQARALNKWKQKNKNEVPQWFTAIADVEVIISLGTLHFNQPLWTFPEFSNKYCVLNGTSIGHPLLPFQQRVTSDFNIEGKGKIALITGSNMAGKSTFLRSLGVNILLAQMGAPVCAQRFVLSPMKLMSSMSIADDLSEDTSTFYAELKKLKSIIEEVNGHQPLFILLDEILRGTNSLDRHAGSKALMQQLIKHEAVAVLATHDVALADLSTDFPEAIANYHFDVQVANEDELYFDYRLKKGVCQSLNAAILMRKIGIEM